MHLTAQLCAAYCTADGTVGSAAGDTADGMVRNAADSSAVATQLPAVPSAWLAVRLITRLMAKLKRQQAATDSNKLSVVMQPIVRQVTLLTV